MTKHILIIEDDPDIREGLRILLEGENFQVEEAENGTEGLHKLSPDIDLIILDVMMPGISGLRTCKEIRQISYVPIIFLTAKSGESDKLVGFMAGADDYLVKPFSYTELLARIKALLRRHQMYDRIPSDHPSTDEWITKNNIRINSLCNQVYVNDTEVILTEIEYEILLLLIKHPDRIFSVQNLYENIWNEPFLNTSGNTIMVHIRNLRKKIEKEPKKPKIIKTVWGKGYKLG